MQVQMYHMYFLIFFIRFSNKYFIIFCILTPKPIASDPFKNQLLQY